MSKVLYIKANPKSNESSNTFAISEAFIETYKKQNPEDEIITLDLYKENIKNLDGNMLEDIFSGVEYETKRHAELFASCDKYIIAAPMWNFSFPAILKSYFDYVSRVGITFKYTEQGPVGLLKGQNKKAVHIVSRGGSYEGAMKAFDFGDSYIRTLLGLFGIEDIATIAFDLTNVLTGDALEAAKQASIQQAQTLAQTF